MQHLNKNYLNKIKLPNTNTWVIFDGIYQEKLSDKCNNLIFDQHTLHIPKDAKIELPIHLIFLASQDYDYNLNIIADENSQVNLIEEYINLDNHAYKNNIEINMIAKANSEITCYKLQNENIHTTHIAHTVITQKQNSKVSNGFIGKGANISRDTLQIKLTEKNACYNAIGIIALNNTQNLSYQTHIEHLAPNCVSNIVFKGIINDKAIGNFNCLITADPTAAKTETHVINRNLLLSEYASFNTAPALEIYADDVIGTHGATVGQLDQDALFYLQSRGIAAHIATKLLTTAFIQEIIDQFAEYCRPKITTDNLYEY